MAGIVAAGLLSGAVSGCWAWLQGRSGCERLATRPDAASPDGSFVLSVYDDACSDGWFVTTLPTTVEVARRGDAGRRFRLLVVENGGLPGDDPRVVWDGPRALSIRLVNPWGARLLPTPFSDLEVTVSIVPPLRDIEVR